jgi:hypothetical protein
MKRRAWLCLLVLLFLLLLSPPKANATITSGTFGKTTMFSWRVEGNTLYITGEGFMHQNMWVDKQNPPWYEFKNTVEAVVFSENIRDIGAYCLKDFSKLKTIVWPEKIEYIFDYAFANCRNINKLEIPDSVTEIRDYAFSGCRSLTSVKLPDDLRDLCSGAFSGCTALESISFPKSLRLIGNRAFEYTVLQTVIIPENVVVLGDYIFCGCPLLKEAIVKSRAIALGRSMFLSCTSLETVYISENVKTISHEAFGCCESLKAIYFMGNMPEFGSRTFFNSTGVAGTFYYQEGNATWTQEKIEKLQPILLGAIVEVVGTSVHYCMEGHREIVDAAVPATCQAEGLTEGKHCEVCEEVLQKQEKIPVTEHAYEDWQIVEESTQEGVWVTRSCTDCGHSERKLLENQTPPPTIPTEPDPTGITLQPEGTTEPTQKPLDTTEPTKMDTAAKNVRNSVSWDMVLIGVLVVSVCGVTGFLAGRKKGQ